MHAQLTACAVMRRYLQGRQSRMEQSCPGSVDVEKTLSRISCKLTKAGHAELSRLAMLS